MVLDKTMVWAQKIQIITAQGAQQPEWNAADMLKRRLLKRSNVDVCIVSEIDNPDVQNMDTAVYISTMASGKHTEDILSAFGLEYPTIPNSAEKHPESYILATGEYFGCSCTAILAIDARGVLYGVGDFLRKLCYEESAVGIPAMHIYEKPAFAYRGAEERPTTFCLGYQRDIQYDFLRKQTPKELDEFSEELMLLGANNFAIGRVWMDPDEDVKMRNYGMGLRFRRTVNEIITDDDPNPYVPEEWRADGVSTRYLCMSHPEARAALLESWDKMMAKFPKVDVIVTNSGDVGGCRCPNCQANGGRAYASLCHEVADIIHKYQPDCELVMTNQVLSRECNQQIFDYLNEKDASWLGALYYGPGADEMQTYIRGEVSPQFFKYEGFGSMGNYAKYIHHQIPRTTKIVNFTDLSHWMQSQYGIQPGFNGRYPDAVLAAVFGRRSWNARPKQYFNAFHETLHYSEGEIYYSEGNVIDDVNKWIWHRLLWNPTLGLDYLVNEYCEYWFGKDAAPEIAQAIFLMEENIIKPVLGNTGIPKAVELLKSAGEKIPANLLRTDHRWRVILHKALLAQYIQMKLTRGEQLKLRAKGILSDACSCADWKSVISDAIAVLDSLETDEMQAVLKEGRKLGEELNQIIGYMEPGYLVVDQMDITEIEWWKQELEKVSACRCREDAVNYITMIVSYENAGEGGFYEKTGWPYAPKHITIGADPNSHLIRGNIQAGFFPFTGPAKIAHYSGAHFSTAYTWIDKVEGAARGEPEFLFENLDPDTQYVVRISTGNHWEKKSFHGYDVLESLENRQALVVNGQVVSDYFAVPKDKTAFYEFELPKDAAKSGTLDITFKSANKETRMTMASEIWLMKKENMPWKLPVI